MAGLAALHAQADTPVTARWPWWRATATASRPVASLLPFTLPGAHGTVDAAAFLLRWRDNGRLLITSALPGRDDDAWQIAARSPQARQVLARRIAEAVTGLGHPWELRITGMHGGDPTARLLADMLPGARLEVGEPVPMVRFEPGQDAADLMGRSVRRRLARAARQIGEIGHAEEIRFERTARRLMEMRPRVEEAHRSRDHEAGRRSDLDDPAGLAFWRAVYEVHAVAGEMELATYWLGGQLAAYVVAFLDPPAYRVFDGRIVTRLADYFPGRRLEAAVLDRVCRSPGFTWVDWMTSVAPGALIASTGAVPRLVLTASSGGAADLTAGVAPAARAAAGHRAFRRALPRHARIRDHGAPIAISATQSP